MKLAISSLVIGFSLISSAVNAEKSSSEGAVYDAAIKANEALELVHNASKEAGILELNDCSGSCNNHPNWDSTAGYYFVYVNGTKVYVRGGSPLRMGTPIYKNEGADKTFFTELAGLSKEQYNSGLTFHLLPYYPAIAKTPRPPCRDSWR